MSENLLTKDPSQSQKSNARPIELPGATMIKLEAIDRGVLLITYDVPGESVNTLQEKTGEELEKAINLFENDPTFRAAVLISGKADSFVAGANIDMLAACKVAEDAEKLCRGAIAGFDRLSKLRKPVVAAVHGAALGGGFELALACHGRVATEHDKTIFALPEVQLGLLPGADGLQRVAAIVGIPDALDIGLTGKNLRAKKAKQLGLVDELCAPSILLDVAIELALKIADGKGPKRKPQSFFDKKNLTALALEKNPFGRGFVFKKAREAAFKKSFGHYPAVNKIIDVLEAFAGKGLEPSREVEAKAFGELVVSEVSKQLRGIFFATTALKKDSGVEDPAVKAHEVKKIAMLGAGLMGAGIAYVSANAGVSVRLKDRDDDGLARGLKYVADIYGERVKRRQMTPMQLSQKMALITGTTSYSGVEKADVVIEAVFEDLKLKHKVLADVEAVTGPETIFASNTSSIPITKIAAGAKRPELVVGMHYFSPVQKMPLLEVIRTEKTAPWVVATAVALGKKQGKTVIVVNDGVGFYTSRILGPLMNEAAYLLAEGAPIDDIDKAMQRWGWPVGPMTLLDEVGIDVAAHVGPIMVEAFGNRMSPPGTISKLTDDGRKGRKNEKGMYLYGDAAKKAKKPGLLGKKISGKPVDTSVYSLLGLTPQPGKITNEEIQMRCSLQFVNEALHCFGEGIVRTPRDGDIGAIFGLGFPPFRGGPFRYVDSVGAAEVLRRIQGYEQQHGVRWTPAPILIEYAKSGKKFYP